MLSDSRVRTLNTNITNMSTYSCISRQQEIQLPLGDVSGVQVFSAPTFLSQRLQVIAKYFHCLSTNQNKFWYRKNDWDYFFFVNACVVFCRLQLLPKHERFNFFVQTNLFSQLYNENGDSPTFLVNLTSLS